MRQAWRFVNTTNLSPRKKSVSALSLKEIDLERFKQNYSRFIWIEVWLEDAQPENRFLRFKGENLKDLRQRGRQP